MKRFGKTRFGQFLERPNRFLAKVKLGRKSVQAFVPTPGRMHELLISGTKLLLEERAGAGRRTKFDVIGVQFGKILVSIDSRVPNHLIREAMEKNSLPEFLGYQTFQPEYRVKKSRLDFRLTGPGLRDCILETKSCTLVRGKRALFPDSPTERGARHLKVLVQQVEKEKRACVMFIIQREDADCFSPNELADPRFAQALRDASSAGVEVLAYRCHVSRGEVGLAGRVDVDL